MSRTGEDAIALEDYLREKIAISKTTETQRGYRQVAPYLQHVLAEASTYTREPDNYNLLVTQALELDRATFITLNYDTLLDTRFGEYEPLNTRDRDWYIAEDRRWSLIKLHGSVNWGWKLEFLRGHDSFSRDSTDGFNQIVDDYVVRGFPTFDNDEIEIFRLRHDLRQIRWNTELLNNAVYYPAIAIPLGPGDTVVCPTDHVRAALEALTQEDGLNILVIGYSGVDDEVLRLFSESGNTVRRLLVANGEGMGQRAAERIGMALGAKEIDSDWVTDHGFTSLVRSDALARWLDDVSSDG
jgi:hypothetical protein